jgi:lipoate-protein ligase A
LLRSRRATGGWAILHTDELTYSVALRPDDPRLSGAILDTYRKLAESGDLLSVVRGLNRGT